MCSNYQRNLCEACTHALSDPVNFFHIFSAYLLSLFLSLSLSLFHRISSLLSVFVVHDSSALEPSSSHCLDVASRAVYLCARLLELPGQLYRFFSVLGLSGNWCLSLWDGATPTSIVCVRLQRRSEQTE